MGSTLRTLRATVLAFHAAKAVSLMANAVAFPRLRDAPSTPLPRVSLLIPARDEARNLPRTLPTWRGQPVAEILLLDDGSSDGTAELARHLAGPDDRLHVITGAALPSGWLGKAWACHQLGRAASGDLLIFCDADVELLPGAVESTVAAARQQSADMFSVFPRQLTHSLGERMIVPLIDDVLLAFLPHRLLSMPVPAAATANGQLITFTREAYDAIGGHAAVRTAVVEDVRLAYTARTAGLRLGLALGARLVVSRMYDGYRETVRGFGKSLRAAHGGSRVLMAVTATGHLVAYTLPWALAGRDRGWAVAAAAGPVQRLVLNASTGRGAPWEAFLVPATPLAALPLYLVASRRRQSWKGRTLQ